jgi:dihydrofolate reductase
MRKIVTGLFITADGVVEEPGDWQEHFDEEMAASMEARLARTDTILLGRKTYEYWYEYWPTSDVEPFATHINTLPKVVVSTTLDSVQWGDKGNITLLKGDLVAEITKLKNQPGKDIAVEGSPTLVRVLMENNLLDELQLIVHPVFAGKGKRFVEQPSELRRLKVLDSVTSRTGTIIVTYQPLPIF